MAVDRISQILHFHLKAARDQLSLMGHGYRIDLPGDDAGLIPSTREDLLLRIDALEGAIKRHEERNTDKS
jgi:hypothetical protein